MAGGSECAGGGAEGEGEFVPFIEVGLVVGDSSEHGAVVGDVPASTVVLDGVGNAMPEATSRRVGRHRAEDRHELVVGELSRMSAVAGRTVAARFAGELSAAVELIEFVVELDAPSFPGPLQLALLIRPGFDGGS